MRLLVLATAGATSRTFEMSKTTLGGALSATALQKNFSKGKVEFEKVNKCDLKFYRYYLNSINEFWFLKITV